MNTNFLFKESVSNDPIINTVNGSSIEWAELYVRLYDFEEGPTLYVYGSFIEEGKRIYLTRGGDSSSAGVKVSFPSPALIAAVRAMGGKMPLIGAQLLLETRYSMSRGINYNRAIVR